MIKTVIDLPQICRCKTAYPIVLVHGIACRDNKRYNPWGRIPQVLAENGAQVFYGNTEAFASIKNNAYILSKQIDDVLAQTGAQKVNLIAYSKGGIDSRYAISSLKVASKVASLTTVATPHRGSEALDFTGLFPRPLQRVIAFFPDTWARLTGEKKADFRTAAGELSAKKMERFNAENPDAHGVYYQSFALLMPSMFSDITMIFLYLIVRIFDGKNDGLVSLKSAKWTNFRGIVKSPSMRGISHFDGMDLRRQPLSKKKTDGRYCDITDFYTDLVEGLKDEGF